MAKPCKCGHFYRTVKGEREGHFGVITTTYICDECGNTHGHTHPPRAKNRRVCKTCRRPY